jgi:hypothetical protein
MLRGCRLKIYGSNIRKTFTIYAWDDRKTFDNQLSMKKVEMKFDEEQI